MSTSGQPNARTDRGPGEVLFEFVRHWSRRLQSGDPRAAEQGRLVLVVEAVQSVRSREPATINAVAHELGIDQSGVSRLVKSAVATGYLELKASDRDGRRREVAITAAGHTMLDQAHRWQEAVFRQLTEQWTERQRVDFRKAMLSLLDRSRSLSLSS